MHNASALSQLDDSAHNMNTVASRATRKALLPFSLTLVVTKDLYAFRSYASEAEFVRELLKTDTDSIGR